MVASVRFSDIVSKGEPRISIFLNFSTGQLTWHDRHIPENLIYVKLYGDHGQGLMKFQFQLANVVKPTSSKRTVVFDIFEAKRHKKQYESHNKL